MYALYEVIERDAVALWWRSRAVRPYVGSGELPRASREVEETLARRGRAMGVLDLTTDVGVPVYVAISWRLAGPPGWAVGFGCHLDAAYAIDKAVSELWLSVPHTDGRNGEARWSPLDWSETACPRHYPHLLYYFAVLYFLQ